MTLAELNAHFKMVRKLFDAEELLENLKAKAGPKAPQLDGLPRAPGAKDIVGNLVAEISDIKAVVIGLREDVSRSEISIEQFAASIDDPRVRTIVRLRFVRGLAWSEVADTLGKYVTEAAVKGAFVRFMRWHQQANKEE